MPTRTLERKSLAPDMRSNEQLVAARAVLQASSIYVLRRLQVESEGSGLVLRGHVESFYHKQLAQELVRTAVEGVEVSNQLQVVYTSKPDYLIETH